MTRIAASATRPRIAAFPLTLAPRGVYEHVLKHASQLGKAQFEFIHRWKRAAIVGQRIRSGEPEIAADLRVPFAHGAGFIEERSRGVDSDNAREGCRPHIRVDDANWP
jgi:hypothetical protein